MEQSMPSQNVGRNLISRRKDFSWNQNTTGLILAVLGAITFSGKGIIVKLGYYYGADAITLLMLRMSFALPFFLLMGWWAGRGRDPLSIRDWGHILALGFTGFYLASILNFSGLAYITASLERLILSLQPTLVLIFAWLLFKKKILPVHFLGIIVSYAGVLVVFGQEALDAANENASLGALLIFLSTVSYATYLIWSGRIVERIGTLRIVGLATSIACFLAIFHYFLIRPADDLFKVAPEVVWLSLLNAIVSTVIPVLFIMMAIRRIGPAMTSQIGMIGPVVTIFLGVMILNEPFTIWVAMGALLVVTGILVFTRAESKTKQSQQDKTAKQSGLNQAALKK